MSVCECLDALGQKQMWCNCVSACGWRCTSFDFTEALACLFIFSCRFNIALSSFSMTGNGLQAGERPTFYKIVLPKIKLNLLKLFVFEVVFGAGACLLLAFR